MKELEKKLGYTFKDKTLLDTALRHSSYANESRSGKLQSNERLEFLGDSILGQVVAAHLYLDYPDMPEGEMTKLRAELVCEQSLHAIAKTLDLGSFISLGRGEENSGGRQRGSILADCVEAIIAAMYLDGGSGVSKDFIERFVLSGDKTRDVTPNTDYKTSLQELLQRTPGNSFSYETLAESGPDHDKTFLVRVQLNNRTIGEGSGRTKKEAEQNAAKAALERRLK